MNSEHLYDASLPTEPVALARLHPTAFAHLTSRRHEPGEMHWKIGDQLARLEAGEIDRLLIVAPPRHGKSELASVYMPAWFLGRNPDLRVIAASYTERLAARNGRQVRDLVASAVFREVFPGISVAADVAASDSWEIAGHDGGYLATGVGGAMTGFGADLLIIDDPIKNMEEATSALQRDKIEEWYHSVAMTRLQAGGRAVVVMTRWHPDDLAGRIMRAVGEGRGGWEVMELPALSADGEALWPERFDEEALARIRDSIDERTWAAMYQQTPMSTKGTVFEPDWFPRFPSSPHLSRRCVARYIAVDTAYKDGEQNDYTVAIVAELTPDYQLYVRDVWRRRVTMPDLVDGLNELIAKWNQDGKLYEVVIEDAASGTSAYQMLRAVLPPPSAALLKAWPVHGSKLERARLVTPWTRRGVIALPHPSDEVPWLFEFEKELFEFPSVIHDDQVDAFVHLIDYLRDALQAGVEAREAYARQLQEV